MVVRACRLLVTGGRPALSYDLQEFYHVRVTVVRLVGTILTASAMDYSLVFRECLYRKLPGLCRYLSPTSALHRVGGTPFSGRRAARHCLRKLRSFL